MTNTRIESDGQISRNTIRDSFVETHPSRVVRCVAFQMLGTRLELRCDVQARKLRPLIPTLNTPRLRDETEQRYKYEFCVKIVRKFGNAFPRSNFRYPMLHPAEYNCR